MRELRLAAGLIQDVAAKKIRVDQTTISGWEVGRRSPTQGNKTKKQKDAICKRICKVYGCTMDELEAAIAESRTAHEKREDKT